MSTPWRITRGDDQFSAKDVADLKLQAAGGKIQAGDLVQPPGRNDWLYASEVPELDGLIRPAKLDEAEADRKRRRAPNKVLRAAAALLSLAATAGGGFGIYWLYENRPDPSDSELLGTHPNALGPLEALATEHATLLKTPDGNGEKVGEVKKDQRVQLVRRLGGYYEIQTKDGLQGWLGTGQVIPGYKFDPVLSEKYDPLFNPDQYLQLLNYSWTPVDEPGKPETLTNMLFELENPTEYGIADVMLRVTFMDGKDVVLDTRNIEVPRLVPPNDNLFISGIEIDIEFDEETRAEVKIFGSRALLPAEYTKLKAEEVIRLAAEAEEAEKKK